jgi:hypothetical protein
MKPIKHPGLQLSSALLAVALAGCSTHPAIQPLSGGYEQMTYPNTSEDAPVEARISLNYRGPDGRSVLIWPSLFGKDEVIKDDVAIFVGDKAYVSSNPDDPRGTKPRLFAVKAPGPPLDITDEVLWYWSKETGKDFRRAVRLFNLPTLVDQGDKVEVQLEFYVNEHGWPDNSLLQLDWNQVAEIMRTVKTKGTMHKDLRWGTPYIEN